MKVFDAKFNNDESIEFSFTNSVAAYVSKITQVKGYFADGKLKVVWLAALGSVVDSDYGDVIESMRKSFKNI